jgi:hypothetical protein
LGRKGKYYYNKLEIIWEGKESTTTITWEEFEEEWELLLQ